MDDEIGSDTSTGPDADVEYPEGYAATRAANRASRRVARELQRKRRVRLMLLPVGVLALALFLAAFWPVMQGRLNAAKQVDQADALLKQANGTVADIDKIVTAQLSPEAAPGVPSVAAQILVARRELDQASALVTAAMPHLTDAEQRRAALMQTSAKARLTMIDRAPVILATSAKAVRAKTLGDQAWRLTTLARDGEVVAARNYKRQSASAVESAAVSVTTIKGRLADARTLYSQAASAFPEAGFDRYVAYVDLKRSETAQLQEAARLWLAGSRPAAAFAYTGYRAAADRSVTAGKALPPAPGNATGDAFRRLAGAACDAYAKAKQQAVAADRALQSG
jgi:hypothetical protein